MATLRESIEEFRLYMDDSSELSTAEEIRLGDRICKLVANKMPWEILRREHTSTVSGTSDTLPDRFSQILQNDNYTDSSYEAAGPVVYVGPNYTPWKVVSISDRRNYRDKKGFAWVDIPNNNLVFASSINDTIEYDYKQNPATLTSFDDTIWIPDNYAPIVFFGMCIDSWVIQQSPKARSYRDENIAAFNMWLSDMKYWNASLVQMN